MTHLPERFRAFVVEPGDEVTRDIPTLTLDDLPRGG